MSVESNIAVRRAAETLLALCAEEAAGMSPEDAKRFWTLLEYHCAEKTGHVAPEATKTQPAKMTDEQARLFGKSLMPWGMHKGLPIEEIDVDYLVYVTESPDFKEELRAYLRSDRVQAEMDEPPAD